MDEGMMSNSGRLVYMANQIARNFETLGQAEAVAATADHIAHFWDPRMRAQILSLAQNEQAGLSPVSAAAIANLVQKRPHLDVQQAPDDHDQNA